jgi:glucosamine-6-phosphate deaminase
MQLIIARDYQEMSNRAAELFTGQMTFKFNSVIGFATGSTPLGLYQKLVEMHKNGELDFSEIISFNLDEYYPISPNNKNSYHYYMMHNLFNKINIKRSNIHLLNGMTEDVGAECKRYDREIERAGGIDLQVLGIGPNGHIGFNEPEEKLHARTHLVDLREETIRANSRFFESKDKAPKKAITVGMATIMKAEKIILLASGEEKAEAVQKTINGYVDTKIPASFLQTHPRITMIADEKAVSLLD